MASSPRVVVTGLGAVTAAGWGREAFRSTLRSGRTAIGDFDRFDHSKQRTHVAGQVPAGPPSDSRTGFPNWKRLSNSDRFALFAAAEALEQANLPRRLDDFMAGVFFGGSTGGLFEAEQFFEGLCASSGPSRTLLASHGLRRRSRATSASPGRSRRSRQHARRADSRSNKR
jgi:3-oxoacyl-[acyl-carrier-protein] synthase II